MNTYGYVHEAIPTKEQVAVFVGFADVLTSIVEGDIPEAVNQDEESSE